MKKQRIVYIDYLRCFSCLAVVLIHIFTTAITDFPNHTQVEEMISRTVINILHFAVPIFFMITGYLFLSKDNDYDIPTFIKKYVLKYLVAIFIFGFVFAIIEEIFNKNYSIMMPITALINTIQGKTWAHMWYLYCLVGVMLLIPVIKVLLKVNKKYIKYILIILLISSIVIPFIENVFEIRIGFDLIIKSPYLAYVIIGYYLGSNDNKKNKFYLFMFIISIVIICTSQILPIVFDNSFVDKLTILGNYDSPIILFLSISIFKLFMNIKNERKIINYISSESYGIYLIHMFWINIAYKFIKFNIYGNMFFIKIVLIFTIVFILSFVSTKFIKLIPFLKKIV